MSGVSWQRRLEEEEELLGEMMRRRRRSEWKVFAKSWRKEGITDCSVESISVPSSPDSCWSDETLLCCQSELGCGCILLTLQWTWKVGSLDGCLLKETA